MTKSLLIPARIRTTTAVIATDDKKMRTINSKAPVTCSKMITIHTDSKIVWTVLTNIDKWSTWQTDIPTAKLHGKLKPGSTFVWKTGGVKIHSSLHTVEPNIHFGWTGKTFGMMAIHNWTLSEHDGKTTVQVDESMEGFLTSLFRKSFTKNLEKGMKSWLNLLKIECEK